MSKLDLLMEFGIPPIETALPKIRETLRQEIDREISGESREDDVAFLSSVQLFANGLLEDSLLIWQAKCSGFDLGSYLDIQMLCGAGLPETKEYLSHINTEEANAALAQLTVCEKAGDFVDWTPSLQVSYYRNYFGLS